MNSFEIQKITINTHNCTTIIDKEIENYATVYKINKNSKKENKRFGLVWLLYQYNCDVAVTMCF